MLGTRRVLRNCGWAFRVRTLTGGYWIIIRACSFASSFVFSSREQFVRFFDGFLVIQSGKQFDRGNVSLIHKKKSTTTPLSGTLRILNRVVLSASSIDGGHGANAARRSSEWRFNSVESPRLRFAGFPSTDNRSADFCAACGSDVNPGIRSTKIFSAELLKPFFR
jgi:hypothetical protein